MDGAKHSRLRKLITTTFTPRQMSRMDDAIRRAALDVVASVAHLGEVDFVTGVAERLPIRTICEIIGLPEDQRDRALVHANAMIGCKDPEFGGVDPAQAIRAFFILLFIAGNETTRHAISHGVHALDRFPDQGNFINAIGHLPVHFTPTGGSA